MDGYLDAALEKSVLTAVMFHVGTLAELAAGQGYAPNITLSGSNLTWVAMSHLLFGLAGQGTAEITGAANAFETGDRIDADVAKSSPGPDGDGIKPDHSFQQHRGTLYASGYGATFAQDAVDFGMLAEGTAYALTSAAQQNLADYAADGLVWELSAAGYIDPATAGRYITRPGWNDGGNPNGGVAEYGAVRSWGFASTRKAELLADAKALIPLLDGDSVALANEVAQIQAAPGDAALPVGHRHFFSSDQTVQKRSDYYASVKMFSTRPVRASWSATRGERGHASRTAVSTSCTTGASTSGTRSGPRSTGHASPASRSRAHRRPRTKTTAMRRRPSSAAPATGKTE
jgi:hypothetical protein